MRDSHAQHRFACRSFFLNSSSLAVLLCNRLVVASMSGTLRDLLVPPQGEKEKHFTPQHIISLASFPALAALSGHVVQQVLDWMHTQRCLAAGVSQLVHLFLGAKQLQVPALQAACLAAAQDHLASAANLSAATALCDEAKRVGGVHEIWDCGFESLSRMLRRQRECLHGAQGSDEAASRLDVGPGDDRAARERRLSPSRSATFLQHAGTAPPRGQHLDYVSPRSIPQECASARAAAGDSEWPHSFTACSAIHALAEKWSTTLSAPCALPLESEWESVVRRARMAGNTHCPAPQKHEQSVRISLRLVRAQVSQFSLSRARERASERERDYVPVTCQRLRVTPGKEENEAQPESYLPIPCSRYHSSAALTLNLNPNH